LLKNLKGDFYLRSESEAKIEQIFGKQSKKGFYLLEEEEAVTVKVKLYMFRLIWSVSGT